MKTPSDLSQKRIKKMVQTFCEKSGTFTHPDPTVTEGVELGLAHHMDTLGKPLCPCRFYPDKQEEIKHRTWMCPCDDMQIYKYCHCLLFTNKEGMPITEYLPEGHDGKSYGVIKDPTPDKGRALRSRAEAREEERKTRPS